MKFISLRQRNDGQIPRTYMDASNNAKKSLSDNRRVSTISRSSRNSVSSTLAELESISQRQAAARQKFVVKSSRRIYETVNKWQNAFLGALAVRAVRSKKSMWRFLYTIKFWIILTVCVIFIAGCTTLGLRTVMAKYAFTISSLESSINSNTQDIQTAQTEVDNKEANLPIVATKMGMQAANNPTPIMLSQPVSEEAVRQALQTPVAGFLASHNVSNSDNNANGNTSSSQNTSTSSNFSNSGPASQSGQESQNENTVNTAGGAALNSQHSTKQTSVNTSQNNTNNTVANLSGKAY